MVKDKFGSFTNITDHHSYAERRLRDKALSSASFCSFGALGRGRSSGTSSSYCRWSSSSPITRRCTSHLEGNHPTKRAGFVCWDSERVLTHQMMRGDEVGRDLQFAIFIKHTFCWPATVPEQVVPAGTAMSTGKSMFTFEARATRLRARRARYERPRGTLPLGLMLPLFPGTSGLLVSIWVSQNGADWQDEKTYQ